MSDLPGHSENTNQLHEQSDNTATKKIIANIINKLLSKKCYKLKFRSTSDKKSIIKSKYINLIYISNFNPPEWFLDLDIRIQYAAIKNLENIYIKKIAKAIY